MSPGSHDCYSHEGFAMGDNAGTRTRLDAALDDVGVGRGRRHVQRKPLLFVGGE